MTFDERFEQVVALVFLATISVARTRLSTGLSCKNSLSLGWRFCGWTSDRLGIKPASGGARIRRDGCFIPGDIIIAVDGQPVDSTAKLLSRLDMRQVGDTVELAVMRAGHKIQLPATLQPGN